jgi:DNA-binding transcriptional regulator YiaG
VQNQRETQKKRLKRTHMTGGELRLIRLEVNLAPRDMRTLLGLCRRTYQDYEAGRRGIPREIATQAREILQRNRHYMAGLPARIAAAVTRDFPDGVIPSSRDEQENE